jgi:hypothetical protein
MCVARWSRWMLVSACALGLTACGGEHPRSGGAAPGGAAGSGASAGLDGGSAGRTPAGQAGAAGRAGTAVLSSDAGASGASDLAPSGGTAGHADTVGQGGGAGGAGGASAGWIVGGTASEGGSAAPGAAGVDAGPGGTASGGDDASAAGRPALAGSGNVPFGGAGADSAPRINAGPELMTGEGTEIELPPVLVGDHLVDAAHVTWAVADPSLVSVTGDGKLRALADAGQTTIVAHVGDETSEPIAVLLVTTQPDVVVVAPEQVLGEVEAVEGPSADSLGRSALVMSSDVGLALDELFIVGGGVGLGGRVASIETTAGGVRAVFELVPLTALFSELELSETIDLPSVESTLVAEEVSRPVALTRFTGPVAASLATAYSEAEAGTFSIGPFACQAEFDTNITPSLKLTVKPELTLERDVTITGGQVLHSGLVARGTVTTSITGKLTLDLPSGALSCSAVLATPTLDAVSLFGFVHLLGVKLPVTVGFDVSAQAQGQVVFAAEGSSQVALSVGFGFDDADGMQPVLELAPTTTFSPSLTVSEEVGRVDGSARIHAGARVVLTAALLDFELATFDAGPRQTMSVATPTEQLTDPEYASDYELDLTTNAASGSAINQALELLGLPKDSLDLTAASATPLARSPQGSLTLEPPSVGPGETAAATVTLDPKTMNYLGADNVASLRIYRLSNDAASLVAELPAAETATWSYTPTANDVGTVTFAAFVVTHGLPAIPLELGSAALTVTACGAEKRLQVAEDGVYDCITGLTWQAVATDAIMSHAEAVDFCAGMGARLPTQTELATIMLGDSGFATGGPYTSGCYWDEAFFSGPCEEPFVVGTDPLPLYWTSTAFASTPDGWHFGDFGGGGFVGGSMGWAYTRCVH